MDPSFGARLRAQREQQQVALSTIADHTKIKLSLLEGLERDDVSHWPGGIFRRAYVRAYAQAIGLEPDAVLREFLELHPEPSSEDLPAAVAAVRSVETSSKRPPTRLRYLIESAFAALPTRRGQPFTGGPPPTSRPDEVRAASASERDEPASPAAAGGEGHPAFDLSSLEATATRREHGAPPIDTGRGIVIPVEHHEYAAAAFMTDSADDAPVADLPFEPPIGRVADRTEGAGHAIAIDLRAVADVCTRLARVVDGRDIEPLLDEAARVLHADGLILWMRDPSGRALRPVLSHGYAPEVLTRLPYVDADEDNAIAAAYRAAEPRVVNGSEQETGAIVVPIVTSAGCAGVLALELRDRGEQQEPVHAVAAIIAAQLAAVVG